MPPNQNNPYDFITKSQRKKRAPIFTSSSQKTRTLQVAIIGFALVILGIVIFSIINHINKPKVDVLYKVAAAQMDIIDITSMGKNNIRDSKLVNQNETANSIITSQNHDLTVYLSTSLGKSAEKKITDYRVITYKKALEDAQKNGNYDTVFTTLLANRLDDYRIKLEAAYTTNKDTELKKQLSNNYQQLNVIFPTKTTTKTN